MPKGKLQAQFSVCMPPPRFRKLTELAKRDGRSRSNYAAQVLEQHLADLEAKAA